MNKREKIQTIKKIMNYQISYRRKALEHFCTLREDIPKISIKSFVYF